MGKGSWTRPYDKERFNQSFDRIFGEGSHEDIEAIPESESTGQEPVVEGDDS